MLVYMYTAMMYGAMTWHHSDQHLRLVCMIQACHQNDGYYIDTCLTLQVETSYYTGCTATHVIQAHVTEAYTCILQK